MRHGCTAVLDIGKTLAKLTLWSPEGRLLARRARPNERTSGPGYPALDAMGIESWLADELKAFSNQSEITAIVPVAHGAAACLIDDDGLVLPPVDYEGVPSEAVRTRYRALRDSFTVTGSPALPAGLNLGIQLLWLQSVAPTAFVRGRIVTWAQYWAWRLSGVAATEVTSLGCHTDLWSPAEGCASPMAVAQGWASRFAPLHNAADVLGPVRDEWRARCGLADDCVVYCGLHDSNADLLSVRLSPALAASECTVLSTGTWFVAMRSLPRGMSADFSGLSEHRDCLVNVDAFGAPVPSARFMGGREAELIEHPDGTPLDVAPLRDHLLDEARALVREQVFALPTFQNGVGPYPNGEGHLTKTLPEQSTRRALAGLYLALMADASLDLIGSRGAVVIEGRFAGDPVFTAMLAALRPRQSVCISRVRDTLPIGALRLIGRTVPEAALDTVEPLAYGVGDYAQEWRARTCAAA